MDRDAPSLRRPGRDTAVAAVRARAGASAGNAGQVVTTPQRHDAVEPVKRPEPRPGTRLSLYARALLIWPGLDRRQLTRTQGDPHKVARLIARRTIHSEEAILSLLQGG